mmetsp:Transcript_86737/g.136847  ORF Transcript_86737/g.136847 Transcript_86737/m.136847 type:complete len:157 (-) Transcript_86737:119-589(-)
MAASMLFTFSLFLSVALAQVWDMSEDDGDMMSYMQAAVKVESGSRHVGTGKVAQDEDDDDEFPDMLSYVQSTVSIDSGVRHVGTGSPRSAVEECANKKQEQLAEEAEINEDDMGGDLLSYVQAGVSISSGIRQVGASKIDEEPVGSSYYTDDVFSF